MTFLKMSTFISGALLALTPLYAQATALPETSLSTEESAMVDWIDAHQEGAIALLEETVNIGSGTMNHEGVRAVGVVMARELNALGLSSRWIEMPPEINRAGHLFASKPGKSKKLLLIGHLDTVFEADDAFQAFTREGNIGQGPGIADMKDGNAVIVYALKALQSIGALDDIAVTVAYTGDEEKTGRPLFCRRDFITKPSCGRVNFGNGSMSPPSGRPRGSGLCRSVTIMSFMKKPMRIAMF